MASMYVISKTYNKQFGNLGGFKSKYLFNVWGESSLAKSEGSVEAPLI